MSHLQMPRLFTYTIPIDDGAAPNPFGGMCTLAICKPGIRRVAKKGDWIAGLGSKYAPSGDLSARLVYAMRVEEVLSLREYDRRAAEEMATADSGCAQLGFVRKARRLYL